MFSTPAEFSPALGSHFAVSSTVQQAMRETAEYLAKDLRFEQLDSKQINHAMQWFVAASYVKHPNLVRSFLDKFAEEIEAVTAWFGVTHLGVETDLRVGDVMITPIPDDLSARSDPEWDLRTRSIATTIVGGSNRGKMLLRARRVVRFALSVLRAALTETYDRYDDSQLRFDLADVCGFIDEESHWRQYRGSSHADLTLPADAIASFKAERLGLDGVSKKIRDKLAIAFGWHDRARETDDLLVRALFLFFGLEALLGDKSEGLKSQSLAFAEALVSLTEDGSFRHPSDLHFLYDEIRSRAVHGSRDFEVTDRDVNFLDEGVTRTIQNFISIVVREKISSVSKFQNWLRVHSRGADLLAVLKEEDPENWSKFNWPPGG